VKRKGEELPPATSLSASSFLALPSGACSQAMAEFYRELIQ